MCGICGQVSFKDNTQIDSGLLSSMNRALTHRGPDDEGTYSDQFSGGALGLAMRRLAIIGVSTGHQPISNETNDVIVVYNGETYNYQELRSELAAQGHVFKTQSDTEVLVHGYEVWGDDMPKHLNGMFAFALWDKKRQRLLLGRDRMGIKPLYYAFFDKRLVFGSEIKALLVDKTVPRELDDMAIDDFLSMRYIPTPRSVYKSIRKLEAGCILICDKNGIQTKKYWDFDPLKSTPLSYSACLEKTDALLEDAVRRQMVSEVPLGTFLSGGIDSPSITYYAKKQNPDLMSFNIYFADKSFSEREEASLVAKHLGTRHVEKEVTADVVHLIPELVNIFDEPFGDDSMIPTYYLNKMAREKMTVALSGDGGDELFAGYPTYLADRAAQIYRHLPAFVRDRAIEPLVNALPVSHNRISLDYKAKAFIRAAHRVSPLEHFGWTEIYDDEAKRILYSAAFREKLRARPLAESYVKAYAEAGRREGIERFLYVDQKTHLLDEFLVKVDRLSMAHSLEVRPPFLDHRLVEWAAEIPMNYKLRGISTKDILRKLMKRRLPDSILTGAKKGFSPPMAKWLSGDLLPYIQKKFSPDHIRNNPYLNPEGPMEFLDEHVNKKANNARRLWTLLMFVEWYDRKVLG